MPSRVDRRANHARLHPGQRLRTVRGDPEIECSGLLLFGGATVHRAGPPLADRYLQVVDRGDKETRHITFPARGRAGEASPTQIVECNAPSDQQIEENPKTASGFSEWRTAATSRIMVSVARWGPVPRNGLSRRSAGLRPGQGRMAGSREAAEGVADSLRPLRKVPPRSLRDSIAYTGRNPINLDRNLCAPVLGSPLAAPRRRDPDQDGDALPRDDGRKEPSRNSPD